MRHLTTILLLILCLTACQQSEDDRAQGLVEQIDSLYATRHYQQALDSIESLRLKFPKAVEARRHALDIWQRASLDLARQDVGLTDSALQATSRQLSAARTTYDRNRLTVRRDSLQTRYNLLCSEVRYILSKQRENETKNNREN